MSFLIGKELTGKAPEIWGCDFINYYRQGYADQLVREAYDKYKEGYIITLMWHAVRPQDDPPLGWKKSVQAKMTDKEWEEPTTPGTQLNSLWLNQVDTVAKYPNELQALGVPTLGGLITNRMECGSGGETERGRTVPRNCTG